MRPVRVQLSVFLLGRPLSNLVHGRIIDHVWDRTHWAQGEELVNLVELQVEDRLDDRFFNRVRERKR